MAIMLAPTMQSTHINDNNKPVIFLGTNSNLYKYSELCNLLEINIAGVIDSDYYGNTEQYCGITVINDDSVFDDAAQLEHYRKNFNFFCAVNWTPMTDPISLRNKSKREKYLSMIKKYQLNCISIVAPTSYVSASAQIGIGSFVDNMVHIESNVSIGNFVNIYAMSHIGHDATIKDNTVLQRMCVAPSSSKIDNDVYFGPMVKALKDGAVFGSGTFIHEGVYIRRGTRVNEVVTLADKNLKRVVSSLDNCL